MSKIEGLVAIGEFVEAVDEQICTVIHEWFIVHK
jgi:hypothetical protein